MLTLKNWKLTQGENKKRGKRSQSGQGRQCELCRMIRAAQVVLNLTQRNNY